MMLSQLKKTVKAHGLIKKGDRVLLCISGGPDSMVLLHLMSTLADSYGISLYACHLDHMLRGRNSSCDRRFAKEISRNYAMPFIGRKRDVGKIASSGKLSIEEAARKTRYEFYKYAAEKVKANSIATGHNLDDQAETVLMRMIKGSGLTGLSGIPYKRKLGPYKLIRPLLDIKRIQILEYLRLNNMPYRIDSSNTHTRFLRNKIRHELIPLLEKEYNPKVKYALWVISRTLREAEDYIHLQAQKEYKSLCGPKGPSVKLGIKRLGSIHPSIRHELIRIIIKALKGDLRQIDYRNLEQIQSVLNGEKNATDLPATICVNRTDGYLVISKRPAATSGRVSEVRERRLNIPGAVLIPAMGLILKAKRIHKKPSFEKEKRGIKKKKAEYIDGAKIKGGFLVRYWKNGDRMRPLGMKSEKKLQDIFVDEKIPNIERKKIPLVTYRGKIVWIAGYKLGDDFKVRSDSKVIIRLSLGRR